MAPPPGEGQPRDARLAVVHTERQEELLAAATAGARHAANVLDHLAVADAPPPLTARTANGGASRARRRSGCSGGRNTRGPCAAAASHQRVAVAAVEVADADEPAPLVDAKEHSVERETAALGGAAGAAAAHELVDARRAAAAARPAERSGAPSAAGRPWMPAPGAGRARRRLPAQLEDEVWHEPRLEMERDPWSKKAHPATRLRCNETPELLIRHPRAQACTAPPARAADALSGARCMEPLLHRTVAAAACRPPIAGRCTKRRASTMGPRRLPRACRSSRWAATRASRVPAALGDASSSITSASLRAPIKPSRRPIRRAAAAVRAAQRSHGTASSSRRERSRRTRKNRSRPRRPALPPAKTQ